jgi:pimeloyl-ACP methyl ester carboxylesterase
MKFFIFCLSTLLISVTWAADSVSNNKNLLLVHGAHFSGSSFNKLKDHLYPLKVSTVTLFDRKDKPSNLSLYLYAQRVCEAVNKFDGQVSLLGHSQGGAVINEALGICGNKIAKLIYVGAVIPFPDEKPFSLLEARDDEYYFSAVSEEKDLFVIKDPILFAKAFAQEADHDVLDSIVRMIRNEPVKPSGDLLTYKLEDLQNISKLVLITQYDRIITSVTQMNYAARLDNAQIVEISSGHLPILTKEIELADKVKAFIFR